MAIILAKTADNPVPESPGKWRAGEVVTITEDAHLFGSQELASAGKFLHLQVTDKTKAEVDAYTQGWNHEPTTVQISAVGDDRLLETTTTMVSVSGQNAFTQVQVENFCTGLNEKYPTANSSYNGHQNDSFRIDITVPLAQREALIEEIDEFVRSVQYKRRRWYIPAASRTFIEGQGGTYAATAAQIGSGGHLRDGLLD